MTEALLQEQIEKRLNQGLLGQWYVIAKSGEVASQKPVAVRALGRNLVLWRDKDGKVQCTEDRCPHRGALLSLGEVHEGNLACRYHGVTVNGEGTIVKVPAVENCPLEGRKAIQGFTVMEAGDGVFAYFPSKEYPEPRAFSLPEELTDGKHASFLCAAVWGCSYRYIIDNVADPMHGPFLHAGTFTLAFGIKQDAVETADSEHGFVITRREQKNTNLDWTEMVTNYPTLYGRVEVPLPPIGGPGPALRILAFTTPIDEYSTRIFFWRTRKVDGLERELWRFLYRARHEERHYFVLEQDREMISSMPHTARNKELLYQSDVALVRLRRVLAQRARSQLEFENRALISAADQPATA